MQGFNADLNSVKTYYATTSEQCKDRKNRMGKKAKTAKSRGRRESYHHGRLREALMQATDEILSERGAEGFSLREAAKRAGVSAAAPGHHFGSAAGLLTEVAISGFEELTRVLRQAAETETAPGARLRAQGMSYVRFALVYPGRFQLMFRHDLLLPDDDRLRAVGQAALRELETSVRAYLGMGNMKTGIGDESMRAMVLGAWSTVHGFAHLALDGKFTAMAHPKSLSDFVSSMLPQVLLTAWPDKEDPRSGPA
jgi:AcrR family transcriptional regulator